MKNDSKNKGDIYQVLKSDHDAVKDLIEKLKKTRDYNQTRQETFDKLKRELLAHAEAEEQVFYNRIRTEIPDESLILEAKEEHTLVEHLLQQLSTGDLDNDQWLARLTVLKEVIEHHVEEEEGDIFPKAKKVVEKEEAAEMAEEMLRLKKEFEDRWATQQQQMTG